MTRQCTATANLYQRALSRPGNRGDLFQSCLLQEAHEQGGDAEEGKETRDVGDRGQNNG